MAYDNDYQDEERKEPSPQIYSGPSIHTTDAAQKKEKPNSGKDTASRNAPPSDTGSQPSGSTLNQGKSGGNAVGNAATGKNAINPGNLHAGTGGSAAAGAAKGAGSAAGGAAAGAAKGAVAGSVAPGVGTAIGAGLGALGDALAGSSAKAASDARKAKEVNDAAKVSSKGSSGSLREEKKSESDTGTFVKVIVGIISVVIALVMIILFLSMQMVESIAAPIMAVFKIFQSGADSVEGLEGRLDQNATFEDIHSVFISDLQDAIKRAYTDVCKDEVYQIAMEQDYDIDLTMESYADTKFPYELDGEKCNINYAEIFNIISLSEEWSADDDWRSFSYSEFQKLYEDKEFLRTLYSLKVERAEKYIVNEAMLSDGETCEIHSDKSVTITHKDKSTSDYSGADAEAYYDVIIYGEVTVSSYGLLELFDYFSIDPYSMSEILPNMTNWKAMDYQEYFTRVYKPGIFWGTEERTRLIPYERQTGEITQTAGDMYLKDIFDASVITEDYVYYEVSLFKQADPRWAARKYLDSNMAAYGCCVTSMAMVINYFGDSSTDPGTLLDKMNQKYQGNLNRPALSEEYGFSHYLDDNSFAMHSDLTKITGELINHRLVIAHIRPNGSEHFATKNGHWIVLHGFQRSGSEEDVPISLTGDGSPGFFFVNDPNRNNETMTFLEAANLIDRIQSYGYR